MVTSQNRREFLVRENCSLTRNVKLCHIYRPRLSVHKHDAGRRPDVVRVFSRVCLSTGGSRQEGYPSPSDLKDQMIRRAPTTLSHHPIVKTEFILNFKSNICKITYYLLSKFLFISCSILSKTLKHQNGKDDIRGRGTKIV